MAGFFRKLLRRLGADGHQTWQGGWGLTRKKSGEVHFHGNMLKSEHVGTEQICHSVGVAFIL